MKSRTICFRKTSFVHTRSGTYYALLLWCFGLKFLPDVVTVSIEYWLRFEAQIRPIRLVINFLLITAKDEMKVRLCGKLFDFFRGRILIRLTWNLSVFFPNSVEILTWNFRKKLFLENFSEILCKPKVILYRNMWTFALLSSIFILGLHCAEKVHTSTCICCLHPGKEARQ